MTTNIQTILFEFLVTVDSFTVQRHYVSRNFHLILTEPKNAKMANDTKIRNNLNNETKQIAKNKSHSQDKNSKVESNTEIKPKVTPEINNNIEITDNKILLNDTSRVVSFAPPQLTVTPIPTVVSYAPPPVVSYTPPPSGQLCPSP